MLDETMDFIHNNYKTKTFWALIVNWIGIFILEWLIAMAFQARLFNFAVAEHTPVHGYMYFSLSVFMVFVLGCVDTLAILFAKMIHDGVKAQNA